MAKKPTINGRGRGLSSDDKTLWKLATKDVSTLENDAQNQDLEIFDVPITPKPPRVKNKAQSPPLIKDLPSLKSPPQLDMRTDLRLKKGQMPIEARLDLHGHTQDMAYIALQNFILQSSRAGFRCVLVITGKGSIGRVKPEDVWDRPKKGILKTMLPQWLSDPAIAPLVLKHYAATQKDGGGGAYYVYLKRIRGY